MIFDIIFFFRMKWCMNFIMLWVSFFVKWYRSITRSISFCILVMAHSWCSFPAHILSQSNKIKCYLETSANLWKHCFFIHHWKIWESTFVSPKAVTAPKNGLPYPSEYHHLKLLFLLITDHKVFLLVQKNDKIILKYFTHWICYKSFSHRQFLCL